MDSQASPPACTQKLDVIVQLDFRMKACLVELVFFSRHMLHTKSAQTIRYYMHPKSSHDQSTGKDEQHLCIVIYHRASVHLHAGLNLLPMWKVRSQNVNLLLDELLEKQNDGTPRSTRTWSNRIMNLQNFKCLTESLQKGIIKHIFNEGRRIKDSHLSMNPSSKCDPASATKSGSV